MKNLKSIVAMSLLAGVMGFGCVEDNATIVLEGLVFAADNQQSSDNMAYVSSTVCRPETVVVSNTKNETMSVPPSPLSLDLMNFAVSCPAWQESGGGGGGGGEGAGSTFLPQPPNKNAIITEKIVVSCHSIYGDVKNCKDIPPIEIVKSFSVQAGGRALLSLNLSFDEILQWEGKAEKPNNTAPSENNSNADSNKRIPNEIVLSISVKYHDMGILHGTSSKTYFIVNLDQCEPGVLPLISDKDRDEVNEFIEAEDKEEAEGEGGGGGGGLPFPPKP